MSCSQSSIHPTITMDLQCWVLVQSPLTLLMGWHLNKIAKKINTYGEGFQQWSNQLTCTAQGFRACEHILALQEEKQMQITGQWSANNASIPIMRIFHYHCSHLAMYRHIHRKTKSTPSFKVKKIRDPAWNYQLQAAEPQQEVFHSPEF